MTKQTLGGTRRKAIRTSGFLTRMQTKNGRKIIKKRRARRRKKLSIQ